MDLDASDSLVSERLHQFCLHIYFSTAHLRLVSNLASRPSNPTPLSSCPLPTSPPIPPFQATSRSLLLLSSSKKSLMLALSLPRCRLRPLDTSNLRSISTSAQQLSRTYLESSFNADKISSSAVNTTKEESFNAAADDLEKKMMAHPEEVAKVDGKSSCAPARIVRS